MHAQRWERVAELYQQASELEPASREAFLLEACAGDDELRREILSLLHQNVTEPGLLESLSMWSAGANIPAAIGAYRILGVIGEGGMGTVYAAEQQDPRRVVALKVVRAGLAIPEVLRRFKQESEALARLQHPGIAQIYDAGIEDGKPYFAMERVRGRLLLEYAAARSLTTAQKLDLAARICDAVQHAHDRGVIHRDLKPGNILVDDSGQPKVLDFGVARLTDSDAQLTRGTDLGKLVGTLAYMSPEQIAGDPAQVDARSDVYALGLILYELLAGRAPYETGRNATEAMRVICDQDPLPLRDLDRKFRGDLDTIARVALEKDKARRYASAADLASDLRRHLAGQPILARPPSAPYLVRKFVQRNRTLTGSLAVIFLVLAGGVVVSVWEASRALRAEQTARAVNEFLRDDLLSQASAQSQATPSTAPDRDLKVRTALDRAAARIQGKFDSQPEVEAAIRQTIGQAYNELGLYNEAQPQMERAFELRRRVLGAEHEQTLAGMQELGELYLGAGKYAQAEAVLTPLLEIQRRKLGRDHKDTLRALNDLGGVLKMQGKYEPAARVQTEVLESDRRVLGPDHPYTLIALSNLASTNSALGKYAEAAALYQQSVEISKRVMGPDHPATLNCMNGLAVVYRNQGKYAGAEILTRQVYLARRRVLGEEHHDTLLALYILAGTYIAQDRYTEAEPLLNEGLRTARRVLPDHPDTQSFLSSLAEVYWKQGKPAQAEPLFREALAARRRILGLNHPSIAHVLSSLAEMKLGQRQYDNAEPVLLEAGAIYAKSASKDWRSDYAQAMLGFVLAQTGRRAEAGPLLESAYRALEQKRDAIPAERRNVISTVQGWYSQIH